MKVDDIREVHDNLINGNRRDMVDNIDNYGLYDFWDDYGNFLAQLYIKPDDQYQYFRDATISYFRISER